MEEVLSSAVYESRTTYGNNVEVLFLFVFFLSSFTLKSGSIPSWPNEFITGNNCRSLVCFMVVIVRLQSEGFCTFTVNVCVFAHWKRRCVWSEHGGLDRSCSGIWSSSEQLVDSLKEKSLIYYLMNVGKEKSEFELFTKLHAAHIIKCWK